jgi:cyclophilin family peptidyl-prolyl cis-trans isomerase
LLFFNVFPMAMPSSRVLLLLALVLLAACAVPLRAADGTLPAVLQTPAATYLAPGATAARDLSTVFGLPAVTGPVVQLQSNLGNFNVELYTQSAPITTANFLSYVNGRAYANTVINRSVAGFVIQGGSYTISTSNALSAIPTQPPIVDEAVLSNVRGTLGMARTSDPNSATDTWFFNLVNNSADLDKASGNSGYAVFAHVLGTGMTVVDAIAALPIYPSLSSVVPAAYSGDFTSTPLTSLTGTAVTYPNWVRFPSIAVIPIYAPDATTTAVLTFTATSSNPSAMTVSVSGHTLTLTAGALGAGASTITLTSTDTNGNQASTQFQGGVTAAPIFTTQPVAQTIAAGSTVAFNAAASGYPAPAYQWTYNDAPIAGATTARYVIADATSANAGSYACQATNSSGGATSNDVVLAFPSLAPAAPGHLVNLSLRNNIQGSLSLGFILGGAGTSGSANLLIRAVGPALAVAPFYLPGVMIDPTLTVVQQVGAHITVAANAGWGSPAGNAATVMNADNATGAFPLTDTSSLDSAVVATLPEITNGYSVLVSGKNGDSGSAIAEVYDDSGGYTATGPRLINLSCLTSIAAGGTLDVGFVLGGSTSKTVLVRVWGPTLAAAPFGLAGTMADPQLLITPQNNSGLMLAANAGWNGDAQLSAIAAQVGAYPFLGATSTDSAVVITAAPNIPYTVQVNSITGGAGNVLVEIYEVP